VIFGTPLRKVDNLILIHTLDARNGIRSPHRQMCSCSVHYNTRQPLTCYICTAGARIFLSSLRSSSPFSFRLLPVRMTDCEKSRRILEAFFLSKTTICFSQQPTPNCSAPTPP
jgi:hypothetical protein